MKTKKISTIDPLYESIPTPEMRSLASYYSKISNGPQSKEFQLFQTIATMAILSNGIKVKWLNFKGTSNLWLVGIAPTASGKSVAVDQVMSLVKASENTLGKKVNRGMIHSPQGLGNLLAKNKTTFKVSDEFGKELEKLLSSDKHGLVGSLLSAYNSFGVFEGANFADEKMEQLVIDDINLGIFAVTTFSTMKKNINENTISSGLINRMLFVPMISKIEYREPVGAAAVYQIQKEKEEYIRGLAPYLFSIDEVSITDESVEFLRDIVGETIQYYNREPGDLGKLCDTDEKREMLGRIRENSVRLAVAIASYSRSDITLDIIKWSYSYVKYNMLMFYDLFSVEENSVEKLKPYEHSEIDLETLRKVLGFRKSNDKYVDLVSELIDIGAIELLEVTESIVDFDEPSYTVPDDLVQVIQGRYYKRKRRFVVKVHEIEERPPLEVEVFI